MLANPIDTSANMSGLIASSDSSAARDSASADHSPHFGSSVTRSRITLLSTSVITGLTSGSTPRSRRWIFEGLPVLSSDGPGHRRDLVASDAETSQSARSSYRLRTPPQYSAAGQSAPECPAGLSLAPSK